MFTLLLVIHILVSIVLIISILLQSGQAGGLSGAFGGGGGNQTLFGGRGAATFLTKATTYFGAAFLAVSFLLAMVQAHRSQPTMDGRNVIRDTLPPATSAPAQPQPAAGGGPATGSDLPVDSGEDAVPLLPPEGTPAPGGASGEAAGGGGAGAPAPGGEAPEAEGP